MGLDRKPHFFIYGRKEILVLFLLVLVVSLFAFTLGVHLGKRVGTNPIAATKKGGDPFPIETEQDAVPGRAELAEQMKGAIEAAEDALGAALHNEVVRTGIQLDTPHATKLPDEAVSDEAGKTHLGSDVSQKQKADESLLKKEMDKKVAAQEGPDFPDPKFASDNELLTVPTPHGKYTVQVGSFPALDEARKRLQTYKERGVPAFVREAELKEKGTWYRVYFGGFPTRKEAENVARKFRQDKKIDSFIVANMPNE